MSLARSRWDPAKHPRGPLGRFVDTSGSSPDFDPIEDPQYDPDDLIGGLPVFAEDEEAALVDFTNRPWINRNIRHGDPDPSLPAIPQGSYEQWEDEGDEPPVTDRFSTQGEYREALDRAIEASQLEEDLTVYRGLSVDFMSDAERRAWSGLQEGDQIRDPGYMSTSIDPGVPGGFGNLELEIDLPAGTHVAMPGIEVGRFRWQQEILVGRGAVLEVYSNRRYGPGIYDRRIQARLVGYVEE